MKRPNQHVIDSLGEGLLRSVLEPLGWAVNKVEQDYGIDFDVEIFQNNESTGVFFKVQLKSSKNTRYSAQGDFISEQLGIQNARYLCNELRNPVIVIHADIETKAVYWAAPQLDVEAIEKLCVLTEQDTITLRIPTTNLLPDTVGFLLGAIGQVATVLASRTIMEVPVPDFLSNVRGQIDPDEFIRHVQDKTDAMRLQKAQELFRNEKFEEVQELVSEVLENKAASTPSKFWALLISEQNEILSQAKAGAPQHVFPKTHVKIGRQLQILTRDGPPHLKFFALIASKAAELESLAYQNLGLYMASQITPKDPYVAVRRAAVLLKLNLLHRQCIRLVNYAANYRLRSALPLALLRIVDGIAFYTTQFEFEGVLDIVETHRRVAFEICRLVRWIASSVGDDDSLSRASVAAMLITRDVNSEIVAWAREVVAEIGDDSIRSDALERFERHLQRIQGKQVKGDGPATEKQILENIQSALSADQSE